MKFQKGTAEVYVFTEMGHGLWAKFTVEDLGSRGRLSIASDLGDWQQGWGACGESFKSFLTHLDIGYVAGKFGADRWFDAERTIKNYRADVLESRRSGLSKETARSIWNEIKTLAGGYQGKNEFAFALYETEYLFRYYNNCPEMYETISPHFHRFWKECWPPFIAELKRELLVNV